MLELGNVVVGQQSANKEPIHVDVTSEELGLFFELLGPTQDRLQKTSDNIAVADIATTPYP